MPPEYPTETHEKKNKKKLILVLAFITLLISGLTTLGLLYYKTKVDSDNQLDSKQAKINELEKRSANFLKQIDALKKPEKETKETDGQQISYAAKAGKFSLTLPQEYMILVRHDGMGEGGAGTDLLIGKSTDRHGIYTQDNWQETFLRTIIIRRSYRDDLQPIIKELDAKATGKINIAGVSADIYRAPGLTYTDHIFFTKNNFIYEIQLPTVGESEQEDRQTLDTIIKGFQFTS